MTTFGEGLLPALTYVAVRSATFLAERMPLWLGDWLARVGGHVALWVVRSKRATVRRNLRRVLGEGPHLDRAVQKAFVSYALYWLETFRLGRYSPQAVLDLLECKEPERLDELFRSNAGLIVVSAHFGFYDLGVAWLGAKGYRVTTVAQVLRPRALFEWFASRRERLGDGIRVVPASPGRDAWRALLLTVQEGDNVVLLADRDLGRRGVRVELFGEETTIPIGPSLLAARTGAPVLAAAVFMKEDASVDGRRGRRRYVIEMEEIPYQRTGDERADVAAVSVLIARALERIVMKAPEQWHLFTPNWPADEPDLPPRNARVDGRDAARSSKVVRGVKAPAPTRRQAT